MRILACVFLLSAAAAPMTAAEAIQGAPMTEPTPRMVVRSAGEVRQDRTARPPAMNESTHAIMMPGQDMPRPVSAPGVRAQPHPSSKPRT